MARDERTTKQRERKATSIPILTPAQRRRKITELIEGGAKLVRARGGDVNLATAQVLDDNAGMLGEAYATASEQSAWFARTIDQMLTGGVWGQFLLANTIVFVQIALIRGWLDPRTLPGPLGFMFAPPPSDEHRAEQERRATAAAPTPNNARPAGATRTPPPGPRPASPGPSAPPSPEPGTPGTRDFRGDDPGPAVPVGDAPDAPRPVVPPPPRPDGAGGH